MDVTDATFQREVIERSSDVPVVVDFWAEWCGPCRALAPVIEREVSAREGLIALAKIDVDANQAVAREYGISSIPAVKAFRNGRVVDGFVGALSPTAVSAFLDALLAPSAGSALLEELSASNEFPAILGPLAEGDYERALAWLLDEAHVADAERKVRIRDVMVAVFQELGQDSPLATAYRRRLATLLY